MLTLHQYHMYMPSREWTAAQKVESSPPTAEVQFPTGAGPRLNVPNL